MLDMHQKAWRAGRDGLSSDIVIYYYGQQVSHVDEEVREFLRASECVQIAAYKVFDVGIVPLLPKHSYDFGAILCDCNEVTGMCGKDPGPYDLVLVAEDVSTSKHLYRSVSEEDKTVLKKALKEKQIELSNHNVSQGGRGTKVHVYLPYRGAISFYAYIVPSGLIKFFLDVKCDKISCWLQPTHFSLSFL